MSLLGLLAASSGGGSMPPIPTPTGVWPETTDPILQALRPSGRRLYWDGLVGGDLGPSMDALKAVTGGEGATGYLFWDGAGPEYRGDLLLAPGQYSGAGVAGFSNIVGTNPADRALCTSAGSSSGVFHTWGSCHLENLVIEAISDASGAPKYCIHMTAGVNAVQTFANVRFDASLATGPVPEGGQGNAGTVGSDGGGGQLTVFYKCEFASAGMNLHGGPITDRPMVMVFIDCIAPHGVGFAGTGTSSGGKDELWVIGGNIASITSGSTTDVYTDRSPGQISVTGAHATHWDTSEWPIPIQGLSPFMRDFYYPSNIGVDEVQEVYVTDKAPMNLVPGRTYIQRVPMDFAARIGHSQATIVTPAGNVALSLQPVNDAYGTPPSPPTGSLTPTTAASAGVFEWKNYYAWTRYPGQDGFWVKFSGTSSACTVESSAQLPGLTECYYTDDGTTLTRVNAGARFPVLRIRGT